MVFGTGRSNMFLTSVEAPANELEVEQKKAERLAKFYKEYEN